MEYVGFWKRAASGALDALFFSPIIVLYFLANWFSPTALFLMIFLTLMFSVWYFIHLVQKNGGTPGNRLLKQKIVKLNGDRVTYKEAILRESIDVFPAILAGLFRMHALIFVTVDAFDALPRFGLIDYIDAQIKSVLTITNFIEGISFIGVFSMLFNPKKRTLQDYIAGTVVVKDS